MVRGLEIDGPWRFRLRRVEDATGVSGTGLVADGARFRDGTCVLRWTTKNASTAIYASHETLMAIHGHGGATVCEWIDTPPTPAFEHGVQNCVQDSYENCAFASIGGLACRGAPVVPKYVTENDRDEWLRGYQAAAFALYGDDWRTCSFGWAPAMSIGS